MYRTRFGKMKKTAREIKFPLHLSRLPRCPRTSAALSGRKMCYPKTTGKRVIKRHAEKLLIYAVIRAIDKRGEKDRLFP
jgi:hypothetical protein